MKWYTNHELLQLNGCCGIGELQGITPYLEYDDEAVIMDMRFFDEERRSYPTRRAAIHAMTKQAKRGYRTTVATIIDDTKENREILAEFLKEGWKELLTSTSNHGRYKIHLLAIQRRQPKEKGKTNAL